MSIYVLLILIIDKEIIKKFIQKCLLITERTFGKILICRSKG